MNKSIIKFKDVVLGHGKNIILKNVNFEIYEGDFVGILGANGTGKTTLLNTILGIKKQLQGQVSKDKNIKFGYCQQRYSVTTNFPITVFEIVSMPLVSNKRFGTRFSAFDKELVYNVLKLVKAENLSERYFFSLSGGQKQRVLIARALVNRPNCLILDEPTSDLDLKYERELLELIKSLNSEKKITVLLVSHEINEIINYAKKYFFLNSQTLKVILEEYLDEKVLNSIFGADLKIVSCENKKAVL